MTERSNAAGPAVSQIIAPPAAAPKITKRLSHVAEYVALRLVSAFIGILPRDAALSFGRCVGRLFNAFMPSRAKIAKDNLHSSFPDMTEAQAVEIVRKCWENLGAGAAEFIKMPGLSREEVFTFCDIEGMELLRQTYAAKKGALLMTAHYGAWEIGAKVWPMSGFNTAVVARRVKNPWVNEWVTKIRNCEGMRVILAREAVRESIRWLKNGNMLAVLIDHRVMEGGLQIPFFGRPAYATALPAILALRYQIPVHPVRCWREGRRIKIDIQPAMDFSGLTAGEADVAEAALRMNKIVESWIRERPETWLWIHNRWKQ